MAVGVLIAWDWTARILAMVHCSSDCGSYVGPGRCLDVSTQQLIVCAVALLTRSRILGEDRGAHIADCGKKRLSEKRSARRSRERQLKHKCDASSDRKHTAQYGNFKDKRESVNSRRKGGVARTLCADTDNLRNSDEGSLGDILRDKRYKSILAHRP